MARKHIDQNGYLVLEANPISMVGVFPYTGEQIDFDGSFGLEKKRIYYVFRPPEELFSKDAMKSFDGMPLTIGHEMLGKGFKSVDRKNHEGCIYNVRPSMDLPGYLLADFTIYTDRAKKAIENGTKQLSLGYRCQYEKRNGEHEGQPYEFVQTNLRGNHIALVPQGRCGSSVCVCDQALSLVLTCDSLPEEIQMNKKEKKDEGRFERLAQAVANGSDEDSEACLDFFDLTPEQRKEALAFAKGKKKEAPATDAKPKCKDELPPAPPAAVETEEEEEEKDDGEKVEKAGVAVATPEGVEGAEATEVEKPEGEAEDGCKCKGKKAQDCGGKVAKDCKGKAKDEAVPGMATEPNAPAATIPLKKGAKAEKADKPCDNCKDDDPADGKCDNCGKPVEEHAKAEDEAGKGTKPHTDKEGKCEEGCNVQCADEDKKTFTKAEMDEAIKKAKAEGRKDGLRAKALADAVSGIKGVGAVSCDEMTEVEVARYAAKRIPELSFAQDAADEVVLGAVKGHLAALRGRTEKPARVFSVAKDSAIAKPQRVCTTDALSKYLAS